MLEVDKASTVEDLNTIIKTAKERIKVLSNTRNFPDRPLQNGDVFANSDNTYVIVNAGGKFYAIGPGLGLGSWTQEDCTFEAILRERIEQNWDKDIKYIGQLGDLKLAIKK